VGQDRCHHPARHCLARHLVAIPGKNSRPSTGGFARSELKGSTGSLPEHLSSWTESPMPGSPLQRSIPLHPSASSTTARLGLKTVVAEGLPGSDAPAGSSDDRNRYNAPRPAHRGWRSRH
jgi:hypothetical protein